ncbi:MAG: class I SAM-dependent methyltransferase [Microcystaceae cyanobacterium]
MSLEELRQKVQKLALAYQEKGDATGWFETLYQQAQGNSSQIPWAKLIPHPSLQNWLNTTSIVENKTALVIGCGLGDDAEALAQKGYSVKAFDISPSAIAWCHQRFPDSTVNYQVANLLDLDKDWLGKFDFIFECRTIQALPLEMRSAVIKAITPLLSPKGILMVITRLRENEDSPSGPPWPLSEGELKQFVQLGLQETERTPYVDPNNLTVRQVCIIYHS